MIKFLRVLFSSETWRALWIALRRSRRDAKARNNVIRIILPLALGVILGLSYVGWYLYQLRFVAEDPEAKRVIAIGLLAGIVLLGAGAAARRLWEWRKEVLWGRRKQSSDNGAGAVELKHAIYREACLLATLLERLCSEVSMEKELPEGFTVTTRRVLLDRLADLKLRDTLEPWLLDVLLAPDGHWPEYLKAKATPAWECLAALRWTLGMGKLRPLTIDPKYNFADANGIFEVKQPEGLNVLPAWEIRLERNSSEAFFCRCWSEIIARGEVADLSQDEMDKALQLRAAIQSEGYTSDFLIGASTIDELPSPSLWSIARRSYNRWSTLCLMADISSGKLPARKLRDLFAEFFATSSPGEEETIRCHFCWKGQDVVAWIISSPSDYPRAYICDECVGPCQLALEKARSGGEKPANDPPSGLRRCSFCHRDTRQVEHLIESPIMAAYICPECIAVSRSILNDKALSKEPAADVTNPPQES